MDSLGVILPGIIIFVSYSVVYFRVQRVEYNEEEQTGIKSSRNLTKSLVKLSVSYMIFNIPIWILLFFDNNALITTILHSFYWPTYVVNFFIYILVWETFQLAAKNLVKDIMESILGISKKQAEEIRKSSTDTQMSIFRSTQNPPVLTHANVEI